MRIAGIVVTYNSDGDRLSKQLNALRDSLDHLIVFDNSDREEVRSNLQDVATRAGSIYRTANRNLGIAEAQNLAAREAMNDGAEYLLFLDDDSSLSGSDVLALAAALSERRRHDRSIAAMGPFVVDERTGDNLVFVWIGTRLRRVAERPPAPVPAAFLLSSGTVIAAEAFRAVGEFRGDFFIDHVDQEWGMRAGAMGYTLLADPKVEMPHRLGDELAGWGAKRRPAYGHRNPVRQYYNTRNAIFLIKAMNGSLGRRVVMTATMLKRTFGALARGGSMNRHYIALGLLHGLANRTGSYEQAKGAPHGGTLQA